MSKFISDQIKELKDKEMSEYDYYILINGKPIKVDSHTPVDMIISSDIGNTFIRTFFQGAFPKDTEPYFKTIVTVIHEKRLKTFLREGEIVQHKTYPEAMKFHRDLINERIDTLIGANDHV